MQRGPRGRGTVLTTAVVWAAAAGLFFAPEALERGVRSAVVDVLVSAQAKTRHAFERGPSSARVVASMSPAERREVAPADRERLRALELRCRRLLVENARLSEELKLAEKFGVSPIPLSAGRKVTEPEVIPAAIINGQTSGLWRSSAHLDRGGGQGVSESSVVLDDTAPHIDQGEEAGLQPELDVFVGRCVVGRIIAVGRWTSTIELVTDSRYRALAQILRPTDQGGTFGAEGILIGQGHTTCKLTEVPTTQSVRVGDEVYTSDRDSRTPVPLYYGRVARVEEAGRNWDITIEPAVKAADLKRVAVLKAPPRLGRMLAE